MPSSVGGSRKISQPSPASMFAKPKMSRSEARVAFASDEEMSACVPMNAMSLPTRQRLLEAVQPGVYRVLVLAHVEERHQHPDADRQRHDAHQNDHHDDQ